MILFLERLELYISSGLPLGRTLEISASGLVPAQAGIVLLIRTDVESGGTLAKALKTRLRISDTIYGLIVQGENSGGLSQALATSKNILEREDELIKKCTSAMVYPAVIGLFAVFLTIGLVRGIMPQIIPMLVNLHVPLPLLTRVVIAVSKIITSYGLYIFIVLGMCIATARILVRRSERVKKIVQTALLKTPLIGNLFRTYACSCFLRSCGSLVDSGVSVAEAYRTTAAQISFLPLRSRLVLHSERLSSGIRLGTVLSEVGLERYIAPIVTAGEASGNLGASLIRAASIQDRDIEYALKKLTALIEPVMMAGLGVVIGSIALSIMMPIYDISRVLQK